MTRCEDCENEDRPGGQYCEACGTKIESQATAGAPQFARVDVDKDASTSDSESPWGSLVLESAPDDSAGEMDSTPSGEDSGSEAPALDSSPDTASGDDWGDAPSLEPIEEPTGAEDSAESTEPAGDVPAAEPARAGYLVFPDGSEQGVTPSQWLLGRADLAKFLADDDKSNEISRGHFTVFQDNDKFYVEDGHTMVQEKASANKTWLIRDGKRILVTGTGRNELQDGDEINVAELVKLQFVLK